MENKQKSPCDGGGMVENKGFCECWHCGELKKELERVKKIIKKKDEGINKCIDHWALVAGPSAYERSGMRVLLEKALKLGEGE